MRESDSPLISVVILNWNGGRLVEECLMSLQAQTYYPLEIFVVDNASTDGSVDLIKMRFPDVTTLATIMVTFYSEIAYSLLTVFYWAKAQFQRHFWKYP